MRSKREKSTRVEQAYQLRYQKVKKMLNASKNDSLVERDLEGEKNDRFEAEYA